MMRLPYPHRPLRSLGRLKLRRKLAKRGKGPQLAWRERADAWKLEQQATQPVQLTARSIQQALYDLKCLLDRQEQALPVWYLKGCDARSTAGYAHASRVLSKLWFQQADRLGNPLKIVGIKAVIVPAGSVEAQQGPFDRVNFRKDVVAALRKGGFQLLDQVPYMPQRGLTISGST